MPKYAYYSLDELDLKVPHECTLCRSIIEAGPAYRIYWLQRKKIIGLGYFHLEVCGPQMLKELKEARERLKKK